MSTYDDVFGIQLNPSLKKGQQLMSSIFLFLENICSRMFVYKGLPEEIPFWAIEKALYFRGQCVFFKKDGAYMVMPCANSQDIDAYGRWICVKPIGFNGTDFPEVRVSDVSPDGKVVLNQEGVMIYNNEFWLPTYALLKPMVNRLAYIWQSLGINEGLTRMKWLIQTSPNLASAIKKEADALLDSGSPLAVVGVKGFTTLNGEKQSKLDFEGRYEPNLYWEDFDNTFFLCLTLSGVNNSFMDTKKERLLAGEIEANNGLVSLANDSKFKYRQDACKQINKIFGLNIVVERYASDGGLANEEKSNSTPENKHVGPNDPHPENLVKKEEKKGTTN